MKHERIEPASEIAGISISGVDAFQGRFRMNSRWTPDFDTRKDQPVLGYATLAHGNIKTWDQLVKAEGHNFRTIPTPNARADGHEPIELLAHVSGSYQERVEQILTDHDVPLKIHKGATMVTEDVYSASPEYWNRDGDWRDKSAEDIMADILVLRAVQLARKKHGRKLFSVTLHLDEETPHIHVLAVALIWREHSKRGRKPNGCTIDEKGEKIDPRPKVWKWSLYSSTVRGSGRQLSANQTEWANLVADLGVIRGADTTKMSKDERRRHKAQQTGRASKLEAEARVRREQVEAETAALLTSTAQDVADLLAQAEAKSATIVAAAEAQRQEVAQEAEKIVEAANISAAQVIVDAVSKAEDLVSNGQEQSSEAIAAAAKAGATMEAHAAAKVAEMVESARSFAEVIRNEAQCDAEQYLRTAREEGARERSRIVDDAEAVAKRIRQDAEEAKKVAEMLLAEANATAAANTSRAAEFANEGSRLALDRKQLDADKLRAKETIQEANAKLAAATSLASALDARLADILVREASLSASAAKLSTDRAGLEASKKEAEDLNTRMKQFFGGLQDLMTSVRNRHEQLDQVVREFDALAPELKAAAQAQASVASNYLSSATCKTHDDDVEALTKLIKEAKARGR